MEAARKRCVLKESIMRLIAIMANTATDLVSALAERPGPYPNGTLLILRTNGRLYFWSGAVWNPMALGG